MNNSIRNFFTSECPECASNKVIKMAIFKNAYRCKNCGSSLKIKLCAEAKVVYFLSGVAFVSSIILEWVTDTIEYSYIGVLILIASQVLVHLKGWKPYYV